MFSRRFVVEKPFIDLLKQRIDWMMLLINSQISNNPSYTIWSFIHTDGSNAICDQVDDKQRFLMKRTRLAIACWEISKIIQQPSWDWAAILVSWKLYYIHAKQWVYCNDLPVCLARFLMELSRLVMSCSGSGHLRDYTAAILDPNRHIG